MTRLRPNLKATPEHLWTASFVALGLFVPFSIAGANAAIMVGLLTSLAAGIADRDIRDRYRGIARDPMLYAGLLLVLFAVPSVFMSEDIRRALRDVKSYWILLVYFLVAYNLVSEKRRRFVFWTLFASMSASALVAFVQYRGGFDFLFIHVASQTHRPGSTLYNMTFAGILYQLLAVNASVALSFRAASGQFIGLCAGIALQITALVLTLTRGAWMALFGGLFSVPMLLRRKRLFLAVVLLTLVGALIALQNDVVRKRVVSTLDGAGHTPDKNVATRLVLWDIAWDIFKDHPVFGVGMGDYTIEAEKRLDGRFVKTAVDAHNVYLQLLATRGLFGFIPFVAFWIVLFRVLFRARRSAEMCGDRFGAHLATGVIAAAVAVLIGALSENNIDDSEVFICFMLLAGMVRSLEVSRS